MSIYTYIRNEANYRKTEPNIIGPKYVYLTYEDWCSPYSQPDLKP